MEELYMIQLLFCSNTKNMPYRSNKSKIYEENLALTATRWTVDGWLVKKRRCEKISFHSRVMCTGCITVCPSPCASQSCMYCSSKIIGQPFCLLCLTLFCPSSSYRSSTILISPQRSSKQLGCGFLMMARECGVRDGWSKCAWIFFSK
jgi:hypothetical protein